MSLRTTVLGVTVLAMPLPALAQSTPHSSNEWWHMNEAATNREVRRDLLSIFEPVEPARKGMFIRQRAHWLVTKAYTTALRGVCQRDTLALNYAAVEPGRAEARLAPYGIETSHQFRITEMPVETDVPTAEGEEEGCAQISRHDPKWFSAASYEVAGDGYRAVRAVLSRIRAKTLGPAICAAAPDSRSGSAMDCAAQVGGALRDEIFSSVESCDAKVGSHCYAIWGNGDYKITVTLRDRQNGSLPEDVESVIAEEYIIVT